MANKQFTRIKFGRNNFVYTFKEKGKLKIYKIFRNKNRFHREINFLEYLKNKNINNIPKIDYFNIKKQYYVSNYIKGLKVKTISKKEITSCINFIKKINKKKKSFQNAVDSCWSISDHCNLVQKNLNMVKKIKFRDKKIENINIDSSVEFSKLKKKIKISTNDFYKKLKKKDCILSPSDFGFHNIKIYKNKLFFFDFEYSGLDDPKKLICDFFCQPDYLIDIKYLNYFAAKIIGNNKFAKEKILLMMLLKIHSIKWICILIKHLYSDPNKLNINYNQKKLKINKYFKRIKSWK